MTLPAVESTENITLITRIRHSMVHNPLLIIGYILMFVFAGWLRWETHERYLPYIDYQDEGVYMALSQEMRGFGQQEALRVAYGDAIALYAYNYIGAAVQEIQSRFAPHDWNIPADYYYTMRRIAAVLGVLTVACIAWAGWLVAGPWAGWVAGMIWAVSPIVVAYNTLAIPDPFVYFSVALTLSAALQAWHSQSARWLLVSLLAAVFTIYSKLWIITIVIPFLIAGVFVWWQWQRTGKRWWGWLLVLGGVSIGSGLFFITVINPVASNGSKIRPYSVAEVLERILDVARLQNNWTHALFPIHYGFNLLSLPVIVALLGLLAYFYQRSRNAEIVKGRYILLLIVYAVPTLVLSTFVSNLTADARMRHIYPLSMALFVIFAAAFVQIIWFLQHMLKRYQPRLTPIVPIVGVLLLAVQFGPTYLQRNQETLDTLHKHHIVQDVWNWFDDSPPMDGIVIQPATGDLHRIWNRIWGAYAGDKPFQWWTEPPEDMALASPEGYYERGLRYLVITEMDLSFNYSDPAIHDLIDQLFLVKTLPADPEQIIGATSYVYRIMPPEYTASFTYSDEINLIGYDLSSETVSPGESVAFRPYWTIERPPAANYSMFIHLYGADDTDIRTQQDGPLLPGSDRLTRLWLDTSEVYFGQAVNFSIPADLIPGDYRLAVGVYDYETFVRLSDESGNEFYTIPITVE